jgi:hypothetical protein
MLLVESSIPAAPTDERGSRRMISAGRVIQLGHILQAKQNPLPAGTKMKLITTYWSSVMQTLLHLLQICL